MFSEAGSGVGTVEGNEKAGTNFHLHPSQQELEMYGNYFGCQYFFHLINKH